ncbi:hypothetical protein [Deinococcus hopiensis]|uniref:Uncharacterized protein n=1 Tax=Deinococcus hopiensis KR-140 TaxID=695939 RepID=A0A1W1UX37_9DEIO|nr:hypothetical protein [Deinococcus hopiensis]SMB85351.1 hypothetical protein SAMN00790413_03370 [Deinococcus hopiensis KR-140]
MLDGDTEVVTVLDVQGGSVRVLLPDTGEEDLPLSSLPWEVLAGDRVGVRVCEGDAEVVLLPHLGGMQA